MSAPAPAQLASPWDVPCTYWIGSRSCGSTPTRLYAQGRRCRAHTPAAVRGLPEPGRAAKTKETKR
ncbi:hypothetical protein NOGI109294_23650 [Nocardiopsis gilva]|uniref:hypothetical protein n=1 Tax=Nocardiopsis gilva TaxID=280236 RepID=UPI0012FE470C|nr:hypothetical protein [Nocardiopsis gilva]